MKDEDKTKEELFAELREMRRRIAELERLEVRVKGSERQLKDSEMRYRFITENIGDVVSQLDADLGFTYVSPSVRRLGYEPEDVVGKHLYSFLTRQSIEMIDSIRANSNVPSRRGVRGDESMIEVEFVAKDGTVLPEEVLFSPYFDEQGTLILYHGVTRNIAKRRQTEEALRESEEKFRHLFEKSAYAIVLIEGETYVDCNEAALALIGASRKEELIGLRPQDISPERQPDGRLSAEKVRERNQITLREGVSRFEWRRRALDGREFWVEVTQTVIPIGGKQVLYTVWTDITERKSAGEALKATTARLVRASKVSRSGNWDLDLDTMVISSSEGASRIYGVEDSNMPLAVIQESPLPQYRRMLDEALNGLIRKGLPYDVEFKIRRTDNGEIVDIHSVAEYDPDRRAVFGVIQDITERKKAEEEKEKLQSQLRQAQKMEAIGQLAGGVAHDFNNILTVITGFATLIRMALEGHRPVNREHVNQLLIAAHKAANLTQSLLAFSRKQVIDLQPYGINALVQGTESLLKRLLTEDIELKVKPAAIEPMVLADATQIDQVLINLAANARDAMPKGGVLSIKTGVAVIDDRFRETYGFGEPGTYALLSVSDTGIGMDAKTLEHIFEPFFTTKEVGKGTGLGLATVYGIVKQHKGYITVSSAPRRGTAFDLYLPMTETGRRLTVSPQDSRGGTETVLVIEDDPAVRKLTTEILRASEYRTLEATDGEDGVRVFLENKETIDLVIMDVVMPKKNGKEAWEEIRRLRPSVRVIFMSGYTGDVVLDKGVEDGKVNFIVKPLSPDILLSRVREALDRN